ncbi:hypothetical protein L1987_24954 [Smallanthus sonchifolius]|uniref:Uncharacterized protein n=1 Tax=Smallanthus sonchifolius TaxID=185202 RepID=A0ACB9INB8_9ASTR|nr:hypothetical protein L1987_24954 [Smallanthus sonchifolius]
MEIKTDNNLNDDNTEDDDALSLRDLQFYDQTATSSILSSPRTSSSHELFEFLTTPPNPTATGDIVFCGSPRHGVRFSTAVKKSKSKRRIFMFGPVRFVPEMEMSSIRERQGRRTPSRMFPVAEGGDVRKTVTDAGTDKNEKVRCRARLNSVLERSLACLRI